MRYSLRAEVIPRQELNFEIGEDEIKVRRTEVFVSRRASCSSAAHCAEMTVSYNQQEPLPGNMTTGCRRLAPWTGRATCGFQSETYND